jgi:hypothetical protein
MIEDWWGYTDSWGTAILLTILVVFVFPPLWLFMRLMDVRDKLFRGKKE